MRFCLWRIPSPVGTILTVTDGDILRALDFSDYAPRMHRLLGRHYGNVDLEDRSGPGPFGPALQAYFNSEKDALDGLKVATGGTDFQRLVWAELRRIPHGSTISYGELARRIGQPTASRAVGLANGQNPIAIVVPCHRVIGTSGHLTGFGGGIERKRWLLAHERQNPATQHAQMSLSLS